MKILCFAISVMYPFTGTAIIHLRQLILFSVITRQLILFSMITRLQIEPLNARAQQDQMFISPLLKRWFVQRRDIFLLLENPLNKDNFEKGWSY